MFNRTNREDRLRVQALAMALDGFSDRYDAEQIVREAGVLLAFLKGEAEDPAAARRRKLVAVVTSKPAA